MGIVLGLATGGMPVRFGRFGYMCDPCELEALGYSRNLGVMSCLVVV
jgi:hypothetical protein